MQSFELLQWAIIVNNTVGCIISSLFLILLRTRFFSHKFASISWLNGFFILLGVAYVCNILQPLFHFSFASAASQLCYQLAIYTLLFGIMRWYGRTITLWLMVAALLHAGIFSFINNYFARDPNYDIGALIEFSGINFTLSFLVLMVYSLRQKLTNNPGEWALCVCFGGCAALELLPAAVFLYSHSYTHFYTALFLTQGVLIFIILVTLLLLFFYSQLEWQYLRAIKDDLTGLFNRRYFTEQARTMIVQRQKEFCISLIDIDHFKTINDTYGHDVGDKVLQRVGAMLYRYFSSDCVVARYGGEEFVILSYCSVPEQYTANLHQFHRAVSKCSIMIYGHAISVTVSIGTSPRYQGDNLHRALTEADRALYYAKANGRDRVCDYIHDVMPFACI